ncbi:hypothetical protein SEUBUCD646_0D00110 [Saccharomyces eubayanus]|nr:hypothetical protein SEUBUCD646_0D00110 [Saccharomyces eubayanus]
MGWRSPGYINDENIRATILKIVNRITKILMVAVWICPGLPLRFPELSILCFSGSNRNLYFDADERVFLIKSRYNKSHEFDSRILFLDVPVSAVLFWYIYILRPFIMSLYPVEAGRLEKALIVSSIGKLVGDSVFDEDEVDGIVAEEEEEEDRAANYALYRDTKSMEVFYNHLDPAEFRETMLRSFVFIDTSNCGLMKRTHFRLSFRPTQNLSVKRGAQDQNIQTGIGGLVETLHCSLEL